MRYQRTRWIKITLTVLLMVLAGVVYSCSRQDAEGLFSDGSNSGVLPLVEDTADGNGTVADPLPPEDLAGARASGTGDEAGSTPPGPAGADAGTPQDTCFVHICGAVNEPGVYQLPEGSRIYQAVEMAGGFLPEADERCLNLAAVVADGMQITVYTKEEAATAVQSGGGMEDSGTYPSKIDINTAGKEALMTLKGIGESRAEAIIAYREEHGPFEQIEDIMLVPGIKDGAFQKIKADITV